MSCILHSGGAARRALREVAILRHLSTCDNSTVLLDVDATFVEFSEIYLVMAPSEANLSQIIRSKQVLSNAHRQYFAVQLLRGVRYMHAAHIVHRDLKPGNLLVNADCALRICDYGLARAWSDQSSSSSTTPTTPKPKRRPSLRSLRSTQSEMDGTPSPTKQPGTQPTALNTTSTRKTRLFYPGEPLSGHVATRWYRSPEVLLQFKEGYGPEMDMWAVGCILAELLLGKPLFPGKDWVDQLFRIYAILGSPPQATLNKTSSNTARTRLGSWPQRSPSQLGTLFKDCDLQAVDLIGKLLTWDPSTRWSAQQALDHPWLIAYHEASAQWTPPPPIANFGSVEFTRSWAEMVQAFQGYQSAVHAEWSAFLSSHAPSSAPSEHCPASYATLDELARGEPEVDECSSSISDTLVPSPSSTETSGTTSVTTPSDDTVYHSHGGDSSVHFLKFCPVPPPPHPTPVDSPVTPWKHGHHQSHSSTPTLPSPLSSSKSRRPNLRMTTTSDPVEGHGLEVIGPEAGVYDLWDV